MFLGWYQESSLDGEDRTAEAATMNSGNYTIVSKITWIRGSLKKTQPVQVTSVAEKERQIAGPFAFVQCSALFLCLNGNNVKALKPGNQVVL